MRRHRAALTAAIIAAAITLGACAPVATWLVDRLDSHDATLAYAEAGLVFDPAGAPAYDTHVSARGEGMSSSDPRCVTSDDARYVDCELGTVSEATHVSMSGAGVIASARYARSPGSPHWLWAYTPP